MLFECNWIWKIGKKCNYYTVEIGQKATLSGRPRPIVQIELPYFQWEKQYKQPLQKFTRLWIPQWKTSAESSYDFRIGEKLFIYHSTSFFFPLLPDRWLENIRGAFSPLFLGGFKSHKTVHRFFCALYPKPSGTRARACVSGAKNENWSFMHRSWQV